MRSGRNIAVVDGAISPPALAVGFWPTAGLPLGVPLDKYNDGWLMASTLSKQKVSLARATLQRHQ